MRPLWCVTGWASRPHRTAPRPPPSFCGSGPPPPRPPPFPRWKFISPEETLHTPVAEAPPRLRRLGPVGTARQPGKRSQTRPGIQRGQLLERFSYRGAFSCGAYSRSGLSVELFVATSRGALGPPWGIRWSCTCRTGACRRGRCFGRPAPRCRRPSRRRRPTPSPN